MVGEGEFESLLTPVSILMYFIGVTNISHKDAQYISTILTDRFFN